MQPNIISRDQHTVSRKQMSQEVLKVLYRLHRTGHLAYLCGAAVCGAALFSMMLLSFWKYTA